MRTNGKKMVGTVLVFKQGTDKKRAENAIKQIQHLLAQPARVHEFNPDQGGPAWYIP